METPTLDRQAEIEKGRKLCKAHRYSANEPSDLGALVLAMLDKLYCGIYHAESRHLRKVDWSNESFIELQSDANGFATYDFSRLTTLVLLAHEYAVRVDLSPCNFKLIKLLFHLREREGGISERHPTIEQAVELFNRHAKN